jgi:outer membrane receptor for ferrienterochelin and colicins
MNRSLSGIAAVAGGLLAWPTAARADDTSELQSLLTERVVSTASTMEQRASVAPALSTTISGKDVQLFGIRTLAEAINFLSLGVMTSDPLRTPDIGSRGVLFANDDGKHFLLLIDGHAVNDPLYGAARFDQGVGVPIDLIDHIEMIVGPGSVLYGSNAMMGVIHVFTKNAMHYNGVHVLGDYEPGRSWRVGGGAGVSFKLFGAASEVTAGAEYDQRFGSDLDFPYQDFSNIISGTSVNFSFGGPRPNVWGGTVHRAHFMQAPSGFVRLRSGDFEIRLLVSAYRRGIPYASSAFAVEFDDPQTMELDRALRIDIKHQATVSPLVQLASRAYADGFDYQRRLDVPPVPCFHSVRVCQYYDVGVARWIGLEERLSLNWLHDQSLVTLLGVDAREQWASAKQDILDLDSGRPIDLTAGHIDRSASLVAPYIQQTYSPTGWLDLNGGARLDYDTRFSPVLSPRGAVALHPWETGTIKAIYSQAFRAPTWAETVLANYLVAPSDNVRPETVRSVEVSFEQQISTQRLLFGVFRTWWENLIESAPLSVGELGLLQQQGRLPAVAGLVTQYSNVASLDNYGWNAGWDGTLAGGQLRYGASATGAFTRRNDRSGSSPLFVAPQLFGNAHVAYAFDGYVPTPALAAQFIGNRPADRLSPTGALLPDAPPLLDLRFTLSGRFPFVPGMTYRASTEYISAARGPYAAGPAPLVTTSTWPAPDFAPIDQYRVMVGLRFDLFGESSQTGKAEMP